MASGRRRLVFVGSALIALFAGTEPAAGCGGYFDQAPPTLDAYPERFGVKTWRQIFPEAYPPPVDALVTEEVERRCLELIARWGWVRSGAGGRRVVG